MLKSGAILESPAQFDEIDNRSHEGDPVRGDRIGHVGCHFLRATRREHLNAWNWNSTSARLTLGKRLSPRAFLMYSRALGTADRSQIIVLEYDQSDRFGFVLTQIGDSTFAIDLRVRRSF